MLEQIDGPDRGATLLWSKAIARPGVTEWLRLKAAMCVDLIRDWRAAVDAATPDGRTTPVQLHAHAFMPPWTLFTGLDFAGIAPHVDAISPKLYTMHWAQMIVRPPRACQLFLTQLSGDLSERVMACMMNSDHV